MNAGSFAKHVKKIHATKDEGLTRKVERQLNNLCQQLKERVEAVNEAIWYQEKINSQQRTCMNYEEFDAYSTPMRDSEIKKAFEEVLAEISDDDIKLLPNNLAQTVEALRKPAASDESNFCRTEITKGENTNLVELYHNINSGALSSDPNQPAQVRWGLTAASNTGCKIYYN